MMDGPCNCINSRFSKHRKSKCMLRNLCNLQDTPPPPKPKRDASTGTEQIKTCYCLRNLKFEHRDGVCHATPERIAAYNEMKMLLDTADVACGIYRANDCDTESVPGVSSEQFCADVPEAQLINSSRQKNTTACQSTEVTFPVEDSAREESSIKSSSASATAEGPVKVSVMGDVSTNQTAKLVKSPQDEWDMVDIAPQQQTLPQSCDTGIATESEDSDDSDDQTNYVTI